MNRRQFTLLVGGVVTQFAVNADPFSKIGYHKDKNNELNEIRNFWFENMNQKPEAYLAQKEFNSSNFYNLRQAELEQEQTLEFQGVYFSISEFALLACLAPISV